MHIARAKYFEVQMIFLEDGVGSSLDLWVGDQMYGSVIHLWDVRVGDKFMGRR